MRPFGWLPEWPKWKFLASGGSNSDTARTQGVLNGNVASQQVSPDWTASIEITVQPEVAAQCPEFQPSEDSVNTWDEPLDLTAIWPSKSPAATVDMDPSLSPDYLESQYKAFLLGNEPLAFFPKQILSKARMGMESLAFANSLNQLLLAPNEIDAKYTLENADTPFFAELRGLVDDMRPLSSWLKVLRVRDTQLQILLGLELIAVSRTTDTSAPEAEKLDSVSQNLDLHFDRLCIWQAVDNRDVVQEFCTTAVIPYYKARAPKKAKQLVRVSRGTLKLRNRPVKQIGKKTPLAHRQDPPLATPGLLKALQMQNHITASVPHQESRFNTSSDHFGPAPAPAAPSKAASRSISHPVYRQQPMHGQVEVRFKKSAKRGSAASASTSTRASPSPSIKHSDTQVDIPDIKPQSRHSAKPARPAATKPNTGSTVEYIEATPTKARSVYLEALPQPTVLFEDDDNVIGSTDSDE